MQKSSTILQEKENTGEVERKNRKRTQETKTSNEEFYPWGRKKCVKEHVVDKKALEMSGLDRDALEELAGTLLGMTKEEVHNLKFNNAPRCTLIGKKEDDGTFDEARENSIEEMMHKTEKNLPDWCFLTVVEGTGFDEDIGYDENSCHSDDDKYCTDDDSEKKERHQRVSLDGKTINTRELLFWVGMLCRLTNSTIFPTPVTGTKTHDRAAALLALCPKIKPRSAGKLAAE